LFTILQRIVIESAAENKNYEVKFSACEQSQKRHDLWLEHGVEQKL